MKKRMIVGKLYSVWQDDDVFFVPLWNMPEGPDANIILIDYLTEGDIIMFLGGTSNRSVEVLTCYGVGWVATRRIEEIRCNKDEECGTI